MTIAWGAGVVDPTFVRRAWAWAGDPSCELLQYVWQGYDSLCVDKPILNTKDLERSITELLAARIQNSLDPFAPYYVMHGAYEQETMAAPPAQPPQYDIAFVMRKDERLKWPLEAKVLETSGRVADYVDDVNEQFLTCRYAPFSGSAAMLGYLLVGDAPTALKNIQVGLGVPLQFLSPPTIRHQRYSRHKRHVPVGKAYPEDFTCHHLVLEFIGVQRASIARSARQE